MRQRILEGRFATSGKRVFFDKGDLNVQARQLAAWMSLTPLDASRPDPSKHPYFPAVIDTAYGGAFFINGRHVESWAGLRLGSKHLGIFPTWDLKFRGAHQNLYDYPVPIFDGKLWLHRQQPPGMNQNLVERAEVYARSIELSGDIAIMVRAPTKYLSRDQDYGPALAHAIKSRPADVVEFIRTRPPQPLIGMRLLEEKKMEFVVDAFSRTFTLSSDRS